VVEIHELQASSTVISDEKQYSYLSAAMSSLNYAIDNRSPLLEEFVGQSARICGSKRDREFYSLKRIHSVIGHFQ